jgi:hypothetical protein
MGALSTFESINQGCTNEVLDLTQANSNVDWYFLGDVHGDPNCLVWAFEFLLRKHDFRFCFLGDLFDRGPEESRCLALLLQFANANPGKVFWIAGNHDVPYQDRSNTVEPIIQNAAMKGSEEALRTLPVIAWFPNGIVATHGGWTRDIFPNLPLPGTHLTGKQKQILQTSRLNDLTAGASDRELDDLPSFRPEDLTYPPTRPDSPPIKLLIRGHDHPMEGFHCLAGTEHPAILTLLGSSQLGVQYVHHLHRKWTTLAKVSYWGHLEMLRINSDTKQTVMLKSLLP